ncbi:hypothetical protein D3C72_1715150 [compost metagenome]
MSVALGPFYSEAAAVNQLTTLSDFWNVRPSKDDVRQFPTMGLLKTTNQTIAAPDSAAVPPHSRPIKNQRMPSHDVGLSARHPSRRDG